MRPDCTRGFGPVGTNGPAPAHDLPALLRDRAKDAGGDKLLEEAAAAIESAREDACVALVADIRFACGDNGKRMQPELVEFVRGLAADAGRYQWLRDDAVHYSTDDGTPHPWVVFGAGSGDCVPHWEHDLDAAIDQALGKGESNV